MLSSFVLFLSFCLSMILKLYPCFLSKTCIQILTIVN
nr:MAG TPA: hypothetical protein [Caudoviricetes sp.]